jgi:hypothetical protein
MSMELTPCEVDEEESPDLVELLEASIAARRSANLTDRILEIVDGLDMGTPSARKTGRDPRWPYVPVIIHQGGVSVVGTRQEQIVRRAFETRDEAIEYADRVIIARRAHLANQMAQPQNRALREHHGLPREIG